MYQVTTRTRLPTLAKGGFGGQIRDCQLCRGTRDLQSKEQVIPCVLGVMYKKKKRKTRNDTKEADPRNHAEEFRLQLEGSGGAEGGRRKMTLRSSDGFSGNGVGILN